MKKLTKVVFENGRIRPLNSIWIIVIIWVAFRFVACDVQAINGSYVKTQRPDTTITK